MTSSLTGTPSASYLRGPGSSSASTCRLMSEPRTFLNPRELPQVAPGADTISPFPERSQFRGRGTGDERVDPSHPEGGVGPPFLVHRPLRTGHGHRAAQFQVRWVPASLEARSALQRCPARSRRTWRKGRSIVAESGGVHAQYGHGHAVDLDPCGIHHSQTNPVDLSNLVDEFAVQRHSGDREVLRKRFVERRDPDRALEPVRVGDRRKDRCRIPKGGCSGRER